MRAMEWPYFLRFASDATIVALCAAGLLVVSCLASLGEYRRARRKQVDRVGWMPWRDISIITLFAGLVLLGFAIIGWLKG